MNRIVGFNLWIALLLAVAAGAATAQPSTAPAWHTAGVTHSRRLSLASYTKDAGVEPQTQPDGSLKLALSKGFTSSYVELKERPEYTRDGVVRIEIAEVNKGIVTLQAVAYDQNGQALNYVDLVENLESPGVYEVPMKIYRTPLKDARQIGLRIWVAGDKPMATIAGVWWAVVSK